MQWNIQKSGDEITLRTYQKDNKCVIEVLDTGVGIGDEAIKHVFERFYREDNSRTRETGGSGLGLSIADMIVSVHGGTIKASHNGDKGTVFIIKLPRWKVKKLQKVLILNILYGKLLMLKNGWRSLDGNSKKYNSWNLYSSLFCFNSFSFKTN